MTASRTLTARCPSCSVKMERPWNAEPLPKGYTCGRCETGLLIYGTKESGERFDACVICATKTFYIEKDLSRPVAFGVLGIGAILSFWTYGVSLILCGALDLFLYYHLPDRQVCYLCETEYRGFPKRTDVAAYDPHKGTAYDARRAIPKFE